MKNQNRIKEFIWSKNWSGNFGFIMPSQMSWQYTQMLKERFGLGLTNVAITNKRGYTTCYYVEEEIESFGNGLSQKVRSGELDIGYWAAKLKSDTDDLNKILEKADTDMGKDLYLQFKNSLNEYANAHRFVKVVVDHLTPAELEKNLKQLEEARVYSEPVYDDARIFTEKLARYIEGKTGYANDALRALTQTDVEVYFDKGTLPEEELLKQRFEQSIITVFGKNEQIILKNYEEYEKELNTVDTNVREISGQIAYKGIVQGPVKIVIDPIGYIGFNDDDILVTGMTRPDYLPLVAKAAALITDAGGMLCHAAITAREMKKPAIIGTQIATKVLKDGDIVEVDAERGIVTILK